MGFKLQSTDTFLVTPTEGTQLGALVVHTMSDTEREMWMEHNQARLQNGLPAYNWTGNLLSIAGIRAEQIASGAKPFEHNNPDGSFEFVNLLNAMGLPLFQWAGENLALIFDRGNPIANAAAAFQNFMDSPKHRDNILDKDFTQIGIASRVMPNTEILYVCVFLKPV